MKRKFLDLVSKILVALVADETIWKTGPFLASQRSWKNMAY